MRIIGYEFSAGARFQPGAKVEAKEVGEYLELLRKEYKGEITPEDVVKAARNKNSPLHSFFEWDDGKAADQYRLQQARGLIRSVVAIYSAPDKPAVRAKAYVHVNEPGAPHYRDTHHALSQKKTRTMVLQQAWRELQAWRQRYRHLKEFSELVSVMDDLEVRLPKRAKGN